MARCTRVWCAALLIAGTLSCRPEQQRAAAAGRSLRDDFGDVVALDGAPPQRIVSLDPATTAMLFAMGAGQRVVGRTRWDTYPPAALAVPDMGEVTDPMSRSCSPQNQTSILLYASADDRDAARRFRAAGVTTLSFALIVSPIFGARSA